MFEFLHRESTDYSCRNMHEKVKRMYYYGDGGMKGIPNMLLVSYDYDINGSWQGIYHSIVILLT